MQRIVGLLAILSTVTAIAPANQEITVERVIGTTMEPVRIDSDAFHCRSGTVAEEKVSPHPVNP